MANKISWPDVPLDGLISIYNDRPAYASDPAHLVLATDRLATGNRRMAIPQSLLRPIQKGYATDGQWDITIPVPPYTKAVGVVARMLLVREVANSAANATLWYKWSTDVSWLRYIVFDQVTSGVDSAPASVRAVQQNGVYLPAQSSVIDVDPTDSAMIFGCLPVTADDEPQVLTVDLKIETDLAVAYLLDYGLFYTPYNGVPYPTV